ncbi:MAG TPA: DHA2 family efflux MFS transporter permease subunit [Dongiaceae bacterium]
MTGSQPSPTEPPFPTECDPRLRLLIPLTIASAFLMEHLDSTIITTAIPRMAVDLGTTVLRMNLAVTTYVLTLAVFIPVSGWLADRFGARRIFVLALLVFTASSALCGLVENLPQLVVARCLQGLGGAMMTPVGRLILLRSFPRSQFVTAMLYTSLPALIGPVMGPLVGGFLTSYASWRWIFYVNIPFGLLGCVLALRFIEDVRDERTAGFDFLGFLMVGVGLGLLQLGIENLSRPILGSAMIATVLAAAIVLLLAFAVHSQFHAAPAVDLTLLRLRTFRVGTLAGGICRVGMNGVPFLLPLMLQVAIGLSPAQSGTLTFALALGAVGLRPISIRLLRLLGFDRVLLWSAIAGAILIAGFALVRPGMSYGLIVGYIALFGLLRSAQFMSSNTLSYADMPADKLSRATSLGGVLQQLSVSFGVSAAALLLELVKGPDHVLTLEDFHQTFLLMALVPLLAVPGFLTLRPEDGTRVSGHRRHR